LPRVQNRGALDMAPRRRGPSRPHAKTTDAALGGKQPSTIAHSDAAEVVGAIVRSRGVAGNPNRCPGCCRAGIGGEEK